MSVTKFTCPPQAASAANSFSDNLVGLQLVAGGGLTQGNFEFTQSVNEKVNRTFEVGTFSEPMTLDSMNITTVEQSRIIAEKNFRVYPNYDLTLVTNFTLYGSMVKRMSVSVQTIISKFPAGLESTFMGINYITGATAFNIVYSPANNETSFDLDVARLRNPFDIDFSVNSTRNLVLRETQVSPLRDMTVQYSKYSLYYLDVGYNVQAIIPTTSLTSGTLKIYVNGNPFSGRTEIFDNIVIRPNDQQVNRVFNEDLDEVENFLLNRNVTPKYTATFQVPRETEDGTYYIENQKLTWPSSAIWNLDITTKSFTNYLTTLNDISSFFDEYQTNLVARFLVTGAFQEFDTLGQKMEKLLQIYGRSFDETKKFITTLAYMNSVHYNVQNDIPSQLLKNLAQTLGWNINISPITNDEFLSSVFGQRNIDVSPFPGVNQEQTPDQLNYQYYRNLILNSAYLFKSKGTRKSVEVLLRLIGAPDALVEFNEYVYVADQRINMSQFETQYAQISGGTYIQNLPTLEAGNLYTIFGVQYTGFTTTAVIQDVNINPNEYPIDEFGFPYAPQNSETYFFQIGSGWFEQTPSHRAPEQVDYTNSVFTGANPNFQTSLVPYTYGQVYLDRYRQFPYMNLGFYLTPVVDNNKSWVTNEVGIRRNLDANLNAVYNVSDDGLVLNVKNVDLFMNPSQGLAYDVWYMSNQYNFPIPNQGLNYVEPTHCNPNPNSFYPKIGGVDWTEINPQPKRKTFFEFAQTFWKNMINTRNRRYITDGKTGGYPTLQSIYWKYLMSEEMIGVQNDNFTYKTMTEYVEGLGDYWIRLVEQMIPATTLWNTGIKYENSIFHRQKFIWRRQMGCQLVPVPCKPCSLTTSIFTYDCPVQFVQCSIYPSGSVPQAQEFGSVLGQELTSFLGSNSLSLNNCNPNSLTSQWYVDIRLDGTPIASSLFFNGVGYSNPSTSIPSNSEWYNAVVSTLNSLYPSGFDYYLTNDDKVVIYTQDCTNTLAGVNLQINVGINLGLTCGSTMEIAVS